MKLKTTWYKLTKNRQVNKIVKNGWDDKYNGVFTEWEVSKLKVLHSVTKDYSHFMRRLEEVSSRSAVDIQDAVITSVTRDAITKFVNETKEGMKP